MDSSQPTGAPQAPKRRLGKPVLIGAGVLAVICLCAGIVFAVVALGANLLGTATTESEAITLTIDSTLQALSKKDSQLAYTFFSKRAQRQGPISKLEEQLDGANFALYEGYLKVNITNWNISSQVNTNPDTPSGLVANISGTVSYEGGYTGQLQATLEKEDKGWRIYGLRVTIPPKKIEEYIKSSK